MTDLGIVQRNLTICALLDHRRIKALRPDALCFIRLGDFYETFNEDAATAARALDIVLTSIPNGRKREPMTGVPAHVAENYFARLLAQGYELVVLEPDAPPRPLSAAVVEVAPPPAPVARHALPAPVAAPWPVNAAVQLSLFGE